MTNLTDSILSVKYCIWPFITDNDLIYFTQLVSYVHGRTAGHDMRPNLQHFVSEHRFILIQKATNQPLIVARVSQRARKYQDHALSIKQIFPVLSQDDIICLLIQLYRTAPQRLPGMSELFTCWPSAITTAFAQVKTSDEQIPQRQLVERIQTNNSMIHTLTQQVQRERVNTTVHLRTEACLAGVFVAFLLDADLEPGQPDDQLYTPLNSLELFKSFNDPAYQPVMITSNSSKEDAEARVCSLLRLVDFFRDSHFHPKIHAAAMHSMGTLLDQISALDSESDSDACEFIDIAGYFE